MLKVQTFALALLLVAPALGSAGAQQADMTFFVTSVGMGKGADLGGLQGADAYCAKLAKAAGAKATDWHAYLSTQAADGAPAVNARDRVGKGPWQNVKGAVIGKDVADLHGANNNLNKDTALTEKGEKVNGRGDKPNMHDILTGTQPDGTAFPPGEDRTCGNWTKGGTEGAVMVGHHDRQGLDTSPPMLSWNSSHPSRGGCSDAALQSTGGAGLFYCFAAK
jgi:hypothetical protein